MVQEDSVGTAHQFFPENLSVTLTVYRWRTFDDTLQADSRLSERWLHSRNEDQRLAQTIRVARVLVNQTPCFGSLENGSIR